MRKSFVRIALIPAICLLVIASGCQFSDFFGPVFKKGGQGKGGGGGAGPGVFASQYCVQFDEVHTNGDTFATELVCDQFATQLLQSLAAEGLTPADIKAIRMVSGSFSLKGNPQGHDWTISSRVDVMRQGGIFTDILVNQTTLNLSDLKGKGEGANLNQEGVNIVDQALSDTVNGGNPILLVTMVGTDVTPTPSTSDPLIFTWTACIDVQAELNL